MKYGPPSEGGPVTERNLRVAEQRSPTPSEAGRASSPPPSSQVLPSAPMQLEILLKVANRRGAFHAFFDGRKIGKASNSPICAAARALHVFGYPDDAVIVARHDGADHNAMSGPLGVWRKLRVREDRGAPRFVSWEPLPRRVAPLAFKTVEEAVGLPLDPTIEPRTPPGAANATPRPRRADRDRGKRPDSGPSREPGRSGKATS